MTKDEIRSEIRNTLINVPDKSLQRVLDYIRAVRDTGTEKVTPAKNLWAMVEEDEELLETLANYKGRGL